MTINAALKTRLAGVELDTPLMAASGCYGYGFEYADLVDLSYWGALVVKGTTREPRSGNPPPRIIETPSGMLNAVGLQNPGIDYFLNHIQPRLVDLKRPIIVNIAGETIEEYCEVARLLQESGSISGIEINVSCPNICRGGTAFGTDPIVVAELVGRVRSVYRGLMIVKLTLEAGNIPLVAQAAEQAGADAISLINTIRGLVIDVHSRRPVLGNIMGGLSGPAIRPLALRAVWEAAGAVTIPLIGMGGISSAEDALQFIMAGATAVAVGTANFVNPHVAYDITVGLNSYMEQYGIKHYGELIGAARYRS